MTASIQQRLCAQVEHCYQQAEAQLKQQFPRPEISFAMRGQAAGAAYLQINKLRFNLVLAKQNPTEFINQVVAHEVAHLLVWQLHGKVKPHGREWQRVMLGVFGLEPAVRHQFDVSAVKPQTFRYRCNCQEHQLTIRRHNKVVRGQAQYQCRLCRSPLQLS
ncbi:SprT family zinc-dependent metalloprotease [Ferrimonas lipolytica]|uniref:Protein SprT n=1 Tax=Ferrimonas lipolytica TaxID=2724191 RepID=A0A6H1UCI5_9GAMM|nr:SprT family zinc-dependent metalloprotease [Ferrimonas lipolytica]QIZ75522.1 SprT family zinc-dependent metalloprotease [Ferrimonas lipolytica]